MQNRYKKTIFSIIALFLILIPQVSLAQGLKKSFGAGSPLSKIKTQTGYSDESIGDISGRVINTALTIIGVVFLLLMVYAGYLWMTARGEETQINKAVGIVKGTVIGLVLVLSAYAITIFVTKGLNPSASISVCQDNPTPCNPLPNPACATLVEQDCKTASACCTWAPAP